jgi:predicted RecA/RadA family phage recombinase
MAQAVFCRGDNLQMMNHTPSGAIEAGEVVLVGQIVGIAHLDIAANTLGALAIYGGSYIVNGDAAITVGKNVYWNNTDNEVTETSTGNKFFGVTVSACAGDGLPCEVAHLAAPTVPPGSGG